MAEATQQQNIEELDTLRRTNSELVTKNSTRKQRIAELEASVAELQAKVAEREASIRTITIDGPLKTMAESISTAPDLWIEQLNKSHRVELTDGKLTLLSTDGKPVLKDGKPVPFERQALIDLLTAGDDPQGKAFKAITIASRASGAATPASEHVVTPSKPKIRFGLR